MCTIIISTSTQKIEPQEVDRNEYPSTIHPLVYNTVCPNCSSTSKRNDISNTLKSKTIQSSCHENVEELDEYPMDNTSSRSCPFLSVSSSSINPIQIHSIALVGLIVHDNAARKRAICRFVNGYMHASFEVALPESQQYNATSVRTVSKLLENVRTIQKKVNQLLNWQKIYNFS